MEKTVALITQKGSLSKGLQQNTTINLFKIANDKVSGVENIQLDEVSEQKFSLLLALKNVSVVYIDSISNDLKHILQTIGITTKLSNDLDDDHFIKQFIFD